jgi:hypothetical protein
VEGKCAPISDATCAESLLGDADTCARDGFDIV